MNRRRRKRKTGLVDVAVEGGEDLMVMLILVMVVVVVVNRFRRRTVQWNDMIQKRRPNEWRMRMVVDGG